jgi:hypothetical protein
MHIGMWLLPPPNTTWHLPDVIFSTGVRPPPPMPDVQGGPPEPTRGQGQFVLESWF